MVKIRKNIGKKAKDLGFTYAIRRYSYDKSSGKAKRKRDVFG